MKPRIYNHLLLFGTIIFTLFAMSCVNQKKVTYFQPTTVISDTVKSENLAKYTLLLKSGDIISVDVSSISPEANLMFNPHNLIQQTGNQYSLTNNLAPAIGYMIDKAGTISLPMVGKVEVVGLNINDASELIVLKLKKYLLDPSVNLRMLNYRVSVMGEVNKPSVYTIPNESISLPEVLSLAGDLTVYARRNNILVIREIDGKRQFARVDLTKRDIFNSPYYYLQPNDVVYVEAVKGKSTSTSRAMQLAPIVMSGISLLVVVLTFVKI